MLFDNLNYGNTLQLSLQIGILARKSLDSSFILWDRFVVAFCWVSANMRVGLSKVHMANIVLHSEYSDESPSTVVKYEYSYVSL